MKDNIVVLNLSDIDKSIRDTTKQPKRRIEACIPYELYEMIDDYKQHIGCTTTSLVIRSIAFKLFDLGYGKAETWL